MCLSLPPREGSSVQLANNNPGGRTHAKESVLPPVSGVQSNVQRVRGAELLYIRIVGLVLPIAISNSVLSNDYLVLPIAISLITILAS